MVGRQRLNFRWTVTAAFATTVMAACSSSSSPKAQAEAGYANVDGGSPTCGPTGSMSECGPARGQTCCFDLNTASGSCVALGSCASLVQFECVDVAGCSKAKVCCAAPGEGGTSLAVSCETSCAAGQVQACQASAECPGGERCAPASPGSVVQYAGISTICAPADAATDDAPAE